nr:hypothetical protein CDS [Bradyrhizobium sp.]
MTSKGRHSESGFTSSGVPKLKPMLGPPRLHVQVRNRHRCRSLIFTDAFTFVFDERSAVFCWLFGR